MSYQDYENNIYKVAKTLKFAYKNRFKFLAGLIAVFAVTMTLVSIKGIVSSEYTFASTYEYGETVSASGKSIFGSAEYEYSSFNTENWTSNFPTLVGNYKARSKGKNNYGSYYHGDTQFFQIVPKKVDVQMSKSTITYGEENPVYIEGLQFKDQLTSFGSLIEDKTNDKWKMTPDVSKIVVTNSAGLDVTSCYVFNPIQKEVDVNKRAISITSSSSVFTYTGGNFKDENYSVTKGSLAEGDSISVVYSEELKATQTNVINTQDYKIFDQNNVDMTSHYEINKNFGSLSLAPRNLTFSTPDYQYTYDGYLKQFTDSSIILSDDSDSVLLNHTVVFELCDQSNFLRAGLYNNIFSAKIMSGDVDVSDYYKINYNFGKTTILPREIEIKSSDYTQTYNGSTAANNEYTIVSGSLANKDIIQVINSSIQPIKSGTYDNLISYKIIDKNTSEDFSDCYVIGKDYGEITINKREITVSVNKVSTTYDGYSHSVSLYVSDGELCSGDSISIKTKISVLHAGTYSDTNLSFVIKDKNAIDVTTNYEINFDRSQLDDCIYIAKRDLGIKVLTKEKTYDDRPISDEIYSGDGAYKVTSGSLATPDSIYFEYLNADYKDVNDVPYDVESEVIIMNNNVTDVTSDYNIDLVNGTFKINKRPITISTIDCEYYYDRVGAIPSYLDTYTIGGDGLVYGHIIKNLSITCSEIVPGTYNYVLDYSNISIVNENTGEDITNNYSITYVNSGKVTINKRPVDVTLTENFKMYDGTPFSSSEYTAYNLIEGDEFRFTNLPEVTHSINHALGGYVENIPGGYDIYTKDNEKVTNCYEPSFFYENIYVLPRPITIITEDVEKTFDGLPYGETTATVSEDEGFGLAEGDQIFFSNFASESVTHVRDSGKNSCSIVIKNKDGLDVTDDYEITKAFGDLIIKPCPLTLSLLEDIKIYDGNASNFSSSKIEVTSTSNPTYLAKGTLPDTYKLEVSWQSVKSMLDAGTYYSPTYFKPTLYFSSTRDSVIYDDDFDVSYEDCSRMILEREIEITSESGSKEYDGNPFKFGYKISNGSLAEGDYIEYEEVEGISNICVDEINPIGKPTIYNSEGEDVTKNYKITLTPGKVTIYAAK